MDNLMGLLSIKVKRGINLAIRDVCSSDPYVVVKMAKQKLKTRVVKKDVNPEWNEDLTLSIADYNLPIHLTVYDHDTFSLDDRMGDAEFDIKPFIEAVKMRLEGLPDGTIITKVPSSRTNCLSEESSVVWKDGKVVQDLSKHIPIFHFLRIIAFLSLYSNLERHLFINHVRLNIVATSNE